MAELPDFDALRAKRNAAADAMIREVRVHMGGDPNATFHSDFDPNACYCTCGSEDNVCEHNFKGWRELEGGRGGERVCERCGIGAMSHSLRCGM